MKMFVRFLSGKQTSRIAEDLSLLLISAESNPGSYRWFYYKLYA